MWCHLWLRQNQMISFWLNVSSSAITTHDEAQSIQSHLPLPRHCHIDGPNKISIQNLIFPPSNWRKFKSNSIVIRFSLSKQECQTKKNWVSRTNERTMGSSLSRYWMLGAQGGCHDWHWMSWLSFVLTFEKPSFLLIGRATVEILDGKCRHWPWPCRKDGTLTTIGSANAVRPCLYCEQPPIYLAKIIKSNQYPMMDDRVDDTQ